MRKTLLPLCMLLVSLLSAQNKQLLYDFHELPQNLMSNPGGEVGFDLHAGLPFFSHLHFSAGSSGATLFDVFQDDGRTINQRIGELIRTMSDRDFFTVNQQMEILSFGWKDKNNYFSAGIYQELDAFAYFPRDMAILAFEGNRNHIGEVFDFSEVAFTAELLNVFHFGVTKYHSEDVNYGFRVKLYSGVLNAQSSKNEGNFRTVASPTGPNQYRHFLREIDLLVQTAGWAALEDTDSTSVRQTLRTLAGEAFLGGNLGLGVDLGFTYYHSDRLKFTGSILDLGFINQKQGVESYRYHGDYYTDGIELLFPGPDEQRPRYWDRWEDDLDEHLVDETLFENYYSWRPVKLNASVDLGFAEETEPCNCHEPMGRRRYKNHLGFHWFAIKRPRGLVNAATVYFDKRFSNSFRARLAYTADSYSFSNIGLMFSTRIDVFNFYLAADNLMDYGNLAKANNASVQLGMQLIMNRQ